MRLVVTQGEPPWLSGTVLEALWPLTLEVAGEPPWEVGRRLVATLTEPPEDLEPEAVRE